MKFLRTVAIILVFAVVALMMYCQVQQKKEQVRGTDIRATYEALEQQVANDIQAEKDEMAERISLGDRLIEAISYDIEYVVYTEDGTYYAYHNRDASATEIKKWLVGSEMRVRMDYTTVFVLSTEDIYLKNNEGVVTIEYNPDDIHMKAFEVNQVIPEEQQGLFGKAYTTEELTALVETATERTKQTVQADAGIVVLSCEAFEQHMYEMAESFGVPVQIVKR